MEPPTARYRLFEEIGSGGMGVVYRGEQIALGRIVAIKMLHPALAARPELVRRFQVEARVASSLVHPGSVAIFDYGLTDDGVPFLVMEYIPGQTLGDYLRSAWPVPLTTVVDLGMEILAAIGDAHAAGVIHADVKSDNVLIWSGRDGTVHAKLVDYGLARLVGDAELGAGGTPEYTAPEVVCGLPVTAAADLYSVGVTLYEMITGEPPFVGDSIDEILDRQVADAVPLPSARQPSREISPALEAVVMRALAKSPQQRYADAAEFAAALAAARPAEPWGRCDCGAALQPRTIVCPTCGEFRTSLVTPSYDAAPTQGWDPAELDRMEQEASDRHRLRLEDDVGAAITLGEVDAIASAYLALARELAATGQSRRAAAELVEGIDLLTAGQGPLATRAPVRLWEMLVELACRHRDDGDRREARHVAAYAQAQAFACGSLDGLHQSEQLLRELRDAASTSSPDLQDLVISSG